MDNKLKIYKTSNGFDIYQNGVMYQYDVNKNFKKIGKISDSHSPSGQLFKNPSKPFIFMIQSKIKKTLQENQSNSESSSLKESSPTIWEMEKIYKKISKSLKDLYKQFNDGKFTEVEFDKKISKWKKDSINELHSHYMNYPDAQQNEQKSEKLATLKVNSILNKQGMLKESSSSNTYSDWDEYVNPDYILVTTNPNGNKLKIAKKTIPGGQKAYNFILKAFKDNNYVLTNKIVGAMMKSLGENKLSESYFTKANWVKGDTVQIMDGNQTDKNNKLIGKKGKIVAISGTHSVVEVNGKNYAFLNSFLKKRDKGNNMFLKEGKALNFEEAQQIWDDEYLGKNNKKLQVTSKKIVGSKTIIPASKLVERLPQLVVDKPVNSTFALPDPHNVHKNVLDVTLGQVLKNLYNIDIRTDKTVQFYVIGENTSLQQSTTTTSLKEWTAEDLKLNVGNYAKNLGDNRKEDEIKFYDLIKKYTPQVYSKYVSLVKNKGLMKAYEKYYSEFPKNGVSKNLHLGQIFGKNANLSGNIPGVINSKGSAVSIQHVTSSSVMNQFIQKLPHNFDDEVNKVYSSYPHMGKDGALFFTIGMYQKKLHLDFELEDDGEDGEWFLNKLFKRFPSLDF